MEKEKLKVSKQDAKLIIFGDHEDFELIKSEPAGNSRWSVYNYVVVQRKSDGKYFADTYSEGATESQNEAPYDYDEPNFEEVFAKEKVVTVYE